MILFMQSSQQLPNYIREKMKEKNLSAADVARKAGNEVSPTTITKIVNGEVNKSGTKTLTLIAKGLGVSEIEILRVANGDDITRPLHFQIYAERFDAGDLSDTEWQFIEATFSNYVERFRLFKKETDTLADPAVDVQKMIDEGLIKEIEQTITPRKRKAKEK